MKKMCYLLLAVLMVLPLMVSCGGGEGTPVKFSNVSVVSYQDAYSAAATGEAETRDETLATTLWTGEAVAYQADPATPLTVKDVVEAYARDFDGTQVFDSAKNMYTKLADLAYGNGFFWNYYVNGEEAKLSTEVKDTDTILIVYEK